MKPKRTEFEIDKDINEYRSRMEEATRRRDFVRINLFGRRLAEAVKEKEDLMADKKFFQQERDIDPALRSWSAKTLALMLNTADMSLYYYDLYMTYFKGRGFEPVPEWERKAREFEKTAKEFRTFVAHFFQGANIDAYFGQMGELLDGVARRCYTDRERKWLEEYEKK